jgi:hypothetical protein
MKERARLRYMRKIMQLTVAVSFLSCVLMSVSGVCSDEDVVLRSSEEKCEVNVKVSKK